MTTIDEKKPDLAAIVEGGDLDGVDLAHAELEAKINREIDEKLMQNPSALPKAVWFIIPNEAGERFCFYGINPLIKPFCEKFLGYQSADAEAMVHTFKTVTYFFPLVGAAISDSFLDKFKTIVSLSSVYVIGLVLLSMFAKPGLLPLTGSGHIPEWGPLLGLFLIALGTGGIKPCVSSHGGDQFLPSQKRNLNKFYNCE